MIIDKMSSQKIFSTSEKEIINYIIANGDKFITMTIDKLAKATYTSNGTVIRLCRKLGFSGYREFRVQFIKELESKKYIKETVDFNLPFYKLQTTNEVVQNITSLYKESLDLCVSHLDNFKLDKAITFILQSTNFFVYASGDAMITAKLFINKLRKISLYPILSTENNEDYAMCGFSDGSECALFISYSGNEQKYGIIAEKLKQNNTKIIAITSNENSSIAKYSDVCISIEDKEKKEIISNFYSQFAFEYILNLIYSLIYAKDYDKNYQIKTSMERMMG